MKTEYFDLKNKRALISGGASGIGSSIVEHLCEQGVEVFFFDIDKKEAKKTINSNFKNTTISTKGRHDPCVGLRAVPIAEAMMACVLADHIMRNRAQCG